jgi:hypothetical protein
MERKRDARGTREDEDGTSFFLFGLLVWKAHVEKHKYILLWRSFIFLGVEEARAKGGSGMKARPRCGPWQLFAFPGVEEETRGEGEGVDGGRAEVRAYVEQQGRGRRARRRRGAKVMEAGPR